MSEQRAGWRRGLTMALGALTTLVALVARGRRRSALGVALAVALLAPTAAALTPNEVVLILDNSGSMGSPWEFQNGPGQVKTMKPSDPERGAILGALLLEALARGSQDRLTVVAFGASEATAPPLLKQAEAIKALRYNTGTFYRRPLEEARRILSAAPRGDGRVLLFFTDGIPTDIRSPDELPALVGLDADPTLDSFALGLWSGESNDPVDEAFRKQAQAYLGRLVRRPEDLEFLVGGSQVVPAFTRAYARALGSQPMVGRLEAGQSKAVDVGKYVVEVLVTTAASQAGPDYHAQLTGPKGEVTARAGDNGCPQGVCTSPRRHFEAFRSDNNPGAASRWTLTSAGPGAIEYGFILRYDFAASVSVQAVSTIGEKVPVEARMLFEGKTFDDDAFFRADGFEAYALVGTTKVALAHQPGGKFTGVFVPDAGSKGLTLPVRAVFKNTWLDLHADTVTRVDGALDLTLRPTPDPVSLGAWQGARLRTDRCTRVDLTGSLNADRLEVTCTVVSASGAPLHGMEGTCTPVPGSEATLPSGLGRPMLWEVCAQAPRCPDDCLSAAGQPAMAVVFAGKDPRYAAGAVRVPLLYQVQGLGWLGCWWPLLALVGGALLALWVIIGWVRPHSFESGLSLKLAGSEPGLRRTSALVLREQPGGVRGFYRNARAALNASGDFVRSPRLAAVVIEAGPGGTTRFTRATGLERKDRRTNQWAAIPPAELSQGLEPKVVYRTGNLYFTMD